MTTQNEIVTALQTVASFIGEDAQAFAAEMLNRKAENDKAALASLLSEVSEPEENQDSDKLSLRTEQARTSFDSRTLGFLRRRKGNAVSANALISYLSEQMGADITGAQMRASLNRLIEQGAVTWEGNKRGTKYAAIMD